jgi:hypothetical protein
MKYTSYAKMPNQCFEPNEWIKEAEIVIEGTVVEVKSFFPEDRKDPDWDHGVKTFTKLSITKYIKGNGPAEIIIKSYGGRIKGKYYWYEDQPEFKAGQKGYLFLSKKWDYGKKDQDYYFPVCGLGVVSQEEGIDWGKIQKAIDGYLIYSEGKKKN